MNTWRQLKKKFPTRRPEVFVMWMPGGEYLKFLGRRQPKSQRLSRTRKHGIVLFMSVKILEVIERGSIFDKQGAD